MKTVKNLIPTIQLNSIRLDLFAVLIGALLIASAFGMIMVMVVSRF
ncbi:MAG: hypothetical protein ACKVOQ_10885 [Cyclobacteriaceae bacterium]|jgi:hypothetical protein